MTRHGSTCGIRPRYCFFFSLLLLSAVIAWEVIGFAVAVLQQHRVAQRPSPLLICENTSHDFGDVPDTEDREHTFQFHVRGDRRVTIRSLEAGCGSCVEVLEYSREPISSQRPGKALVRLLVKNQHGSIAKTVVVKSDDPVSPYMVLTLKANVLASDVVSAVSTPSGEPPLAPRPVE